MRIIALLNIIIRWFQVILRLQNSRLFSKSAYYHHHNAKICHTHTKKFFSCTYSYSSYCYSRMTYSCQACLLVCLQAKVEFIFSHTHTHTLILNLKSKNYVQTTLRMHEIEKVRMRKRGIFFIND